MNLPLVVMIAWNELLDPIGESLADMIGNPLLVGLVILLFFTMFALFLLIPFSALLVIEIPLCFVVFEWIPQLRPVVGIMVGILIGMALIKWVRR
jgi:hypothetical protein